MQKRIFVARDCRSAPFVLLLYRGRTEERQNGSFSCFNHLLIRPQVRIITNKVRFAKAYKKFRRLSFNFDPKPKGKLIPWPNRYSVSTQFRNRVSGSQNPTNSKQVSNFKISWSTSVARRFDSNGCNKRQRVCSINVKWSHINVPHLR